MAIRTEQTLRRMWDESLTLHGKAAQHAETMRRAEKDEEAADMMAAAARTAASASREISEALTNESADLVDLVNRERADAGLAPLAPGEPYPADPAPVEQSGPGDTLVASAQSSTVTRTDGEVAGNA